MFLGGCCYSISSLQPKKYISLTERAHPCWSKSAYWQLVCRTTNCLQAEARYYKSSIGCADIAFTKENQVKRKDKASSYNYVNIVVISNQAVWDHHNFPGLFPGTHYLSTGCLLQGSHQADIPWHLIHFRYIGSLQLGLCAWVLRCVKWLR